MSEENSEQLFISIGARARERETRIRYHHRRRLDVDQRQMETVAWKNSELPMLINIGAANLPKVKQRTFFRPPTSLASCI
jgi:hypothetical protein